MVIGAAQSRCRRLPGDKHGSHKGGDGASPRRRPRFVASRATTCPLGRVRAGSTHGIVRLVACLATGRKAIPSGNAVRPRLVTGETSEMDADTLVIAETGVAKTGLAASDILAARRRHTSLPWTEPSEHLRGSQP